MRKKKILDLPSLKTIDLGRDAFRDAEHVVFESRW